MAFVFFLALSLHTSEDDRLSCSIWIGSRRVYSLLLVFDSVEPPAGVSLEFVMIIQWKPNEVVTDGNRR